MPSVVTWDGFLRVLPLLADRGTIAWWCYLGTSAWLFLNVYFNYLACMLVDPGVANGKLAGRLVRRRRRSRRRSPRRPRRPH